MSTEQALRNRSSTTPVLPLLLSGLLGGSLSAFGLGIALPDQDAFAIARGNAFTATADDPAAVFYNPAGISQLQNANISLGGYGIMYGSAFKNGPIETQSKTQWEGLLQVFGTYALEKYHLTFGLGFYEPYGLRVEWPNTSPIPGGGLGQIHYYTINPVVSYQVLPSLSLAAGPTFNYSEVELIEYPGFTDQFHGHDTAAGYNLGVLWHPLDQHSFGVTYRSGTVMNYTGHGTDILPPEFPTVPASAKFHFPQTVEFGYSYRPTTNWNIEADGTWTDWSGLKTVPLVGANQALAFNWQAAWNASFGVTRYLGNGWRVSGGYMFTENAVPSANFIDLLPDEDHHVFSVGVGKTFGHFSCDAAYQFAWGPSRSVTGDAGDPAAMGNYEFFSHALSFNIGYHF